MINESLLSEHCRFRPGLWECVGGHVRMCVYEVMCEMGHHSIAVVSCISWLYSLPTQSGWSISGNVENIRSGPLCNHSTHISAPVISCSKVKSTLPPYTIVACMQVNVALQCCMIKALSWTLVPTNQISIDPLLGGAFKRNLTQWMMMSYNSEQRLWGSM